MTVQEHAAAILAEIERTTSGRMALAVACCHAEDAYCIAPDHDGDAARIALGMAFLRSLAVGQPEHSA